MLKPLVGAIALALIAAPSFAAASQDVGQAKVRVDDLKPGNPADTLRLQKRVKAAALSVCGAHEDSVRMVKWAVQRSDCFKETYAQATAQTRTALASR